MRIQNMEQNSAAAEFGLMFTPVGLSAESIISEARTADRLGYHSLWVSDHLIPAVEPERDLFECLTTMGALTTATERIRLGTIVICTAFRNPALLAKALCTLDHLSNGRLIIGLGAGYREDEFKAYGYDFPPVPERLRRFEETVQVIKAMLVEPRATFKGRFHSVEGAINNPKPLQKPHPPIMIGGGGRKVMLKLVAKYADWWNFGGANPYFDELLATLKEHCRTIGRDFSTLRVTEVVNVCLGRTEQEAREKYRIVEASGSRSLPNTITGTADQVIQDFQRRVAKGVSLFLMHFPEGRTPETVEYFSRAVMP